MTHLFRLAILYILATGLCLSQFANQEISGFVVDPSNASVPGAGISLRHLATGQVQTTASDARGYYAFLDVRIGEYEIAAEAKGFKKYVQTNVVVSVSAKATVPIHLTVGDLQESVTVRADSLQIETSGGDVGRLITGEEAANLQLNGRSFAQLLTLLPGVSSLTRSPLELLGAWGSNNSMQSVNGGRRSTTSWNVDGVDDKDNGGSGTVFVRVNVDAIAEFKVLTSGYSAENGQNSGAVVNLAVKSGTRDFHGSPYGFLRSGIGNAGWNLGGPIYIPRHFNTDREKLFFFVSQDFLRMDTYTWMATSVPAMVQRKGDFSAVSQPVVDPAAGSPFPGNVIPASRIDRNSSRLVANAPAPNAGQLNEYDRSFTTPTDDHQYIQKLDYHANDRHQLALLYLRDGFYQLQNQTALELFDRHITGANASARWTWSRGSRSVNTFQFSESGNAVRQRDFRPNPIYTNDVTRRGNGIDNPMLYGNAWEIPDIGIQGYAMPAVGARSPDYFQSLFQWKDDFSHLFGAHILKAGMLVMRSRKQQSNTTAQNGSFSFRTGHRLSSGNALADALLGNFNTYTESSGMGEGWFRFTQAEFYLQDNWKVTRRLSLDIGVRFHYMQPQYSALGNDVVFDAAYYSPAKAVTVLPNGQIVANSGDPLNGLVLGGTAFPQAALDRYSGWNVPATLALFRGLPKEIQSSEMPAAPRVGFAWDVTGAQRTVLRGAWGLFFERIQGNAYFNTINNPPFIGRTTLYSGNIENPTGGAPASAFPQDVVSFPVSAAIPTVEQYNFGLQQRVGRAMLLDVSYVGSSAWHLYRGILPNQLPVGTMLHASSDAVANSLRPYAGLGNIGQLTTSANSNYNSLQVELRRQMLNGGSISVAYTWSRNITDATDYNSNPQDSYNFRNDRGLSGYHRAHVLSASYVYPLPFWRQGRRWYRKVFGNWQISGIVLLETGLPFDLTASGDPAAIASTGGNLRPNVLGDWTAGGRTAAAWFNTAAFGAPAPGTFGNLGRNVLIGPALMNWDASIQKNFRITERLSASFRSEIFNALNHWNYWGVEGDMTSPRFGQVTTTTDPRVGQVMLRLSF